MESKEDEQMLDIDEGPKSSNIADSLPSKAYLAKKDKEMTDQQKQV